MRESGCNVWASCCKSALNRPPIRFIKFNPARCMRQMSRVIFTPNPVAGAFLHLGRVTLLSYQVFGVVASPKDCKLWWFVYKSRNLEEGCLRDRTFSISGKEDGRKGWVLKYVEINSNTMLSYSLTRMLTHFTESYRGVLNVSTPARFVLHAAYYLDFSKACMVSKDIPQHLPLIQTSLSSPGKIPMPYHNHRIFIARIAQS